MSGAWDELVGAALLGTQRRPVPLSALPPAVAAALEAAHPDSGPHAATGLLDAAALLTVYRRAGAAPLRGREPVLPAPATDRRAVGRPASARLAALLAQLGPDRPGGTADAIRLLEEWLAAVADRGLVAPPALLPELLDLAVRRRELAPGLASVLGSRGCWLAELRSDWAAAVAGRSTLPTPAGARTDEAWTLGTGEERRAELATLRAADPAAARAALAALDWRAERGEDRAAFVAVLADGLSLDDEDLLERARSDRRQDVRGAAERLLTLLPGSAYVRRLSEAARACLRVERQRLHRVIVVTLPDPEGPIARQLSLPPAPAGVGPAAWLLRHLVAVPPPNMWESVLGDDAAGLVGLPVADGLADVVHAGWAEAAARHRDAAWARALLAASAQVDPSLLAVLPERERVAGAVAALRRAASDAADATGVTRAAACVSACPAPWAPPLSDAFFAWLACASAAGPPWAALSFLANARFALPAASGTVDAARAVADRQPAEGPWRTPVTALAHTLAVRHQMLEELR